MNLDRMHAILADCCHQFRKGPEVAELQRPALRIVKIMLMPPIAEARAELEKIDVHFFIVGVDKPAAERHRAELLGLLAAYPDPRELQSGPSYIAVGARLGSQGAALCLFALGQALGLWKVITPGFLGLEGEDADRAAGNGYVMCSGWRAGENDNQAAERLGDAP